MLFYYQVHHLQRVLSKKRDPVTKVCFINEYSKTNNAHLVNRHWESLTTALRDKLTHAAISELSFDDEQHSYMDLYLKALSSL